uniref:Uncharacterized protein n=1 Tax=Arundo donax TaxID=35708 RepID=A0A0A9BWP1_ARUDO
MQIHRSGFSR